MTKAPGREQRCIRIVSLYSTRLRSEDSPTAGVLALGLCVNDEDVQMEAQLYHPLGRVALRLPSR